MHDSRSTPPDVDTMSLKFEAHSFTKAHINILECPVKIITMTDSQMLLVDSCSNNASVGVEVGSKMALN